MSGSSMLVANASRGVFSLGSVPYTVRDVIDAAHFRGEVQPVWEELLRMQACEERATEEEREIDDAAVDTAAQTFRYDHDLITAEETERWLADRGLTLADFSDYFSRHYWGEAIEDVEPQSLPYVSATPELRELLIAELMLSGELGRMANRLSWRLASGLAGGNVAGSHSIPALREEFLERQKLEEEQLGEWLAALGRDEDWLQQMLNAEAAYWSQRESLLTPQALKRELGSLRLQLTVFDVEVIEFDSHDAACEALFCVRDDSMPMEEVATEGRYPFQRQQLLLEDIAPDLQPRFLSVSAGEVLEPMEVGGTYRLCRIAGKSEPDPEDEAVRRRVEQRLLERHFSDLASRHVRWELALS
ncbi:MAG: hypothetical protein ABR589_01140 [Chthoniobacterales bacterium]